jgi:hypothetical protein
LVNLPFFNLKKKVNWWLYKLSGKNAQIVLYYDIGTHAARQAEIGVQNFAEYFLILLNRSFKEKTEF